ncbi:MAG: methyltransferase [Chitinophagaceae bacterium]
MQEKMIEESSEKCCTVVCDKPLDKDYWNAQYSSNNTKWDLNEVSPAIRQYIDQIQDSNIKILIPGCGNAHEAHYLLQKGFKNIHLIDIAPVLVNNLKEKYKNNHYIEIIEGDFFEHQESYDLILEQTFFCAIAPTMRQAYADKVYELLKPHGKLVGVLFDKEFEFDGPPFGGCKCKYVNYFEGRFDFKVFEKCSLSHPKRKDEELFIILQKIAP